ncbi:MAG: hypothetical protein P1V18_06460, partial [Candidatus Gracilibacteria bacterium]|nr:hypothetical protein [Candidatus Gracilibacteria bacterium]
CSATFDGTCSDIITEGPLFRGSHLTEVLGTDGSPTFDGTFSDIITEGPLSRGSPLLKSLGQMFSDFGWYLLGHYYGMTSFSGFSPCGNPWDRCSATFDGTCSDIITEGPLFRGSHLTEVLGTDGSPTFDGTFSDIITEGPLSRGPHLTEILGTDVQRLLMVPIRTLLLNDLFLVVLALLKSLGQMFGDF